MAERKRPKGILVLHGYRVANVESWQVQTIDANHAKVTQVVEWVDGVPEWLRPMMQERGPASLDEDGPDVQVHLLTDEELKP